MKRFLLIAVTLTSAALLASLAGNFLLFNKAKEFYAREAAVRMAPIDDAYQVANKRLLQTEKTKPRLIIFGESRCSMWYPYHPDNWGDIEIVNRGIGGETTPQIRGRMQSDVLQLDPDVVLLQMGDNDLKTITVLPGTKEQAIQNTYNNIVDIAKTLSNKGIHVIITTIFPTGRPELSRKPVWSDEINKSIDIVNQRLLNFEYPNVTTVNCDKILRQELYIKPEYSLDTLHLTAEGYAALNIGLEPVVRKLLETRR